MFFIDVVLLILAIIQLALIFYYVVQITSESENISKYKYIKKAVRVMHIGEFIIGIYDYFSLIMINTSTHLEWAIISLVFFVIQLLIYYLCIYGNLANQETKKLFYYGVFSLIIFYVCIILSRRKSEMIIKMVN